MTFAMTQNRLRPLAVIAGLAFATAALSGCSDTRQALGWDKSAPDEFSVVSRAPLSMPPNFALRPPDPGATRPQEGAVRDQARAALLGRKGQVLTPIAKPGRSIGEVAMLKEARADQALPEIRSLVNRETTSLIEADSSFVDKLVFWQTKAPPGQAVDAAKETQRLRENQALGRAATEGETPVIKRKQKGILEGIF